MRSLDWLHDAALLCGEGKAGVEADENFGRRNTMRRAALHVEVPDEHPLFMREMKFLVRAMQTLVSMANVLLDGAMKRPCDAAPVVSRFHGHRWRSAPSASRRVRQASRT